MYPWIDLILYYRHCEKPESMVPENGDEALSDQQVPVCQATDFFDTNIVSFSDILGTGV